MQFALPALGRNNVPNRYIHRIPECLANRFRNRLRHSISNAERNCSKERDGPDHGLER